MNRSKRIFQLLLLLSVEGACAACLSSNSSSMRDSRSSVSIVGTFPNIPSSLLVFQVAMQDGDFGALRAAFCSDEYSDAEVSDFSHQIAAMESRARLTNIELHDVTTDTARISAMSSGERIVLHVDLRRPDPTRSSCISSVMEGAMVSRWQPS